jgi:hypothetical protein
MRLIYVSGPYRALTPEGVQANINRARIAAQSLWAKGWAVICPHMNSAHFEGESQMYLDGDLAIIDRLDPEKDALYMLNGWSGSEGARDEHRRALEREITVYYQGLDEPPDLREPPRQRPDQREQTLEVLQMLTTFVEKCATLDFMQGEIKMDVREVPAAGEFREYGTFGIESATITIRSGRYAEPDLRSAHA